VNEVEREMIEEIVESVAKRHSKSKKTETVGGAIEWMKAFRGALWRAVRKYEKHLIVVTRPTASVAIKSDSEASQARRSEKPKSPEAGPPRRVA